MVEFLGQNMKDESIIKTFVVFIFLTIVSNLIILIRIPLSNGYEISIYGIYPWYFWLLLVIGQIISICIIVLSAENYTKYWRYGLLAIFINYTIILFLPTIRGYFLFATPGYDVFFHLSEINYIYDTGYLSEKLIYPITHLFMFSLNLFIGRPQIIHFNFVAALFSYIYILFFYVFGRDILKDHIGSMFALAFAIPLMFSFLHHAFIPFFFALCFFPLLLYCIHKRNSLKHRFEFTFLTLVLSLLIVFFHPLVTVMLIIVLIGFYLFNLFSDRHFESSKQHFNITILLGLTVVSLLAWYLNYQSVLNTVENFIDAIFETGQSTIIGYQLNAVESSSISLSTFIELFIRTYGTISIYFVVAFCCLIITIINISNGRVKQYEMIYGIHFVASMLFAGLIFFVTSVINEPIRAASFVIVIATAFCAMVLYNTFKRTPSKTGRKILLACTILIICSASVIGMFNIYEGPWRGLPSSHMPYMNAYGLDWYIGHNNNSIPLISNFNSIKKYERYYYSKTPGKGWSEPIIIDNFIPSHFGYETNDTLSKSLKNNKRYMVTFELIKQFQFAVIESERWKYPQYDDADYDRLDDDPTVNKIYTNREFLVWIVES